METILENISAFFEQSPEWVYFIIGIVSVVMLFGIIKNKDWAIDPESSNQRFFYQTFGRGAFRIVAAGVAVMGAIAGFSGYYFYAQMSKDIQYDNPIVQIKSIQSKNSYDALSLTIENYDHSKKELLASFIYNNKRASALFDFALEENQLNIIKAGKESDYFLQALAALYKEKLTHQTMKDTTSFTLYRKGESQKIDLFDKENEYALEYKPNTNDKGSVSLRMTIDLETGQMKLWEKNGGIAKKNLIRAFEK